MKPDSCCTESQIQVRCFKQKQCVCSGLLTRFKEKSWINNSSPLERSLKPGSCFQCNFFAVRQKSAFYDTLWYVSLLYIFLFIELKNSISLYCYFVISWLIWLCNTPLLICLKGLFLPPEQWLPPLALSSLCFPSLPQSLLHLVHGVLH